MTANPSECAFPLPSNSFPPSSPLSRKALLSRGRFSSSPSRVPRTQGASLAVYVWPESPPSTVVSCANRGPRARLSHGPARPGPRVGGGGSEKDAEQSRAAGPVHAQRAARSPCQVEGRPPAPLPSPPAACAACAPLPGASSVWHEADCRPTSRAAGPGAVCFRVFLPPLRVVMSCAFWADADRVFPARVCFSPSV